MSASSNTNTTSPFRDNPHYQAAINNKSHGPVFIGSLKEKKSAFLFNLYNEIKRGEKPPTQVFFPLRQDTDGGWKDEWRYEDNMAFMAGVIDALRPVILTTPIKKYGQIGQLGVTNAELLWLKNNGYTFRLDPDNDERMYADPPATKSGLAEIKPYHHANAKVKEECRNELWEGIASLKKSLGITRPSVSTASSRNQYDNPFFSPATSPSISRASSSTSWRRSEDDDTMPSSDLLRRSTSDSSSSKSWRRSDDGGLPSPISSSQSRMRSFDSPKSPEPNDEKKKDQALPKLQPQRPSRFKK
jgi:hypothetical protein